MKTPEEVLLEAADYLENRGWTRGVYADENGCLCLAGALNLATIGRAAPYPYSSITDQQWALARQVTDLIEERCGIESGPALAEWNDAPDRTRSEVVSMLRRAAGR